MNNVTDADLDRTEKNADWLREYLGKTWGLLMLLRGHSYKLPMLFDGATAYQMQLEEQLHPNDIPEANVTLTMLSDKKRAGPFDKEAHGDALQRVSAFTLGYHSGPTACSSTLKPLPTPWRPPY